MPKGDLKRILYAEDEEDIRTIAQIALEDIGGFDVKYCCNGREAVESVENFHPDLLLFDVMMPEMDGVSALQMVRKITSFKDVPAIFMTAKIKTDEINEYKAIGILGVISKPFDPMTLAATIKELWDKCSG